MCWLYYEIFFWLNEIFFYMKFFLVDVCEFLNSILMYFNYIIIFMFDKYIYDKVNEGLILI